MYMLYSDCCGGTVARREPGPISMYFFLPCRKLRPHLVHLTPILLVCSFAKKKRLHLPCFPFLSFFLPHFGCSKVFTTSSRPGQALRQQSSAPQLEQEHPQANVGEGSKVPAGVYKNSDMEG